MPFLKLFSLAFVVSEPGLPGHGRRRRRTLSLENDPHLAQNRKSPHSHRVWVFIFERTHFLFSKFLIVREEVQHSQHVTTPLCQTCWCLASLGVLADGAARNFRLARRSGVAS